MSDDPKDRPPPAAESRGEPSFYRRFARLWGFAGFLLLVAILFRHVLLPFVFAVLLAYILAPAINRMAKWHLGSRTLPRGAAVILCYILVLGVFGVFFGAFLPRLSKDFARLGREAPALWERVDREWMPRVADVIEDWFPSLAADPSLVPVAQADPADTSAVPPGTLVYIRPLPTGDFVVTVPPDGIEIQEVGSDRVVIHPRTKQPKRGVEAMMRERIHSALGELEGQAGQLFQLGRAIVAGVLGLIMKLVLSLMVAAFMLVDLDRIHNFLRGVVPSKYRGDYEQVVAGIDRGLGGVIRGQLLICLVNGVLTYIGLFIFDVKYPLLLAAVAGVMSLIPIFGSILSSIPIVTIAMVSGKQGVNLWPGVFMLGWILAIHFLEANLLNPKIIGTAAKMHPVLVVFSLIAGEYSYGLVGALLAVPVASIIQTLFVFFRSRAWRQDGERGQSVAGA